MRRPNIPPSASLAYAAAAALRHLPTLCGRTWWTPQLVRELVAAEDAARELDDLGLALTAAS